jgi:hypothetical protein
VSLYQYEGADGVAYLNATKEHHVTDVVMGPGSVAVTAAAGTGWRYEVAVSELPRDFAGGKYIVAVLNPWTAAYSLGDPYALRAEQVLEKLVPAEYASPANVAAMTMTINYALQKLRDHYLELPEKDTK